MKLVHVVDDLDAVGGVQTYLRQLLPALEARGIANAVLADGGLQADGAEVAADALARLHAALAESPPDAVLVHIAPSPSVARAAAEHAPTLVYAHDYAMVCPGNARYLHRSARLCAEGPGLRCFWRAYTERTTNRRPDRLWRAYARARAWPDVWPSLARVLVASPFVEELLAGDGVPRDRIRVVAYPVEPPPPAEPEAAGDVLFVNRLVASKGVHVLLRAAAGLGASVAIAGDGPERGRLEALAGELGVDARFLGWVDAERRSALLRGARVFVLPSLWEEPFGIAGVEALAAGVPVVASAVGGIPFWLTDGGLLVPPGDPPALRDALMRVLEEPGLRADLAARAPAAAARFSLDAHLALLLPELEAVA